MTKNEIIRDLAKCNPQSIKSLSIIYHNSSANVRYVYDYEFTSFFTCESRRELAKVLLSLYKLRGYIVYLDVRYFSDDSTRSFRGFRYASSISDFIKYVELYK